MKITPNSNLLPFTQIFFILIWSSGFIAVIEGLHYAEPLTYLFYRMLFAALFMGVIAWWTKAPWPRNRKVLAKTIVAGLLTQFLYLNGYFYSLYLGISATVMAIILALQPLLTAVIYSLIFKHNASRAQYLGLFMGFIGVVITVGHDLTTHIMTTTGVVVAMITLLAITLGSIVQKSNPEMDLRSGSTIQFAVSTVLLYFICFYLGALKLPLATNFLISLAWLALGISVTGNYLYYKLLKGGSAVKVNSLFYLVPAVIAVVSYFLYGQAINIYIVMGIMLIVIGVLITQRNERNVNK